MNACVTSRISRCLITIRTNVTNHFANRIAGCVLAAATALGLSVAAAGQAQAQQAMHRPITDFTNAQAATIGFSTPSTCVPPQCPGRIAGFDYAGGANHYLVSQGLPSLGTTVEGSITERPLPDSRAEVTVVLHTTNALAVVSTWDPTLPSPPQLLDTNPRLFGFTAAEILANPVNNRPALGDLHLVLTFKNTAAGAPMPDLHNWLVLGNSAPGQELVSIYINGNATGPLHALAGLGPEGTPGRCVVSEIGVLFRGPFKGATTDGFPVEKVDLHAIGR